MSRPQPKLAALVGLCLVLVGCSSVGVAPVESRNGGSEPRATVTTASNRDQRIRELRPGYHVVRAGDTLQAIAFRYRVDARDLARWNSLRNPNLIIVGDRLRLTPPPRTAEPMPPPSRTAPPVATRDPVVARKPPPAPSAAPTPKTPTRTTAPKPPAASDSKVRFRWPADGQVRTGQSPLGGVSLQIVGKRGQPILAAAAGEVVYSGSGLVGYGKLIIVKHNEALLSAYAHNEELLVGEGSSVRAGQKIARMGSTEATRVMLHFEIRKDGKAVDPLAYLPPR